jgi:glycogen synthase
MRVLMTTDSIGGVWTYALELTDALADRGVEVTLATMGGRLTRAQRAELSSCDAVNMHTSSFALEWMEEPWVDVQRAGEWLLEIAHDVEPEVIHLNAYSFGSLSWPAPVVLVGHSDVVSWHRAVRAAAPDRRYDRYRAAVTEGIGGADLFIAPTRALLAELEEIYNPPCPRMVIPNGCARYVPDVSKQEMIVSVGRAWDDAKNIAALVDVAPRMPWPVVVAGEGHVGKGVRALGVMARADVTQLLAAASVFAEPARYEPFGLAAVEAGCARCALVLGDIPSLREVWDDAALFVPPGDRDVLQGTLLALIEDAAFRAQAAERAARRAAEYTIERAAGAYIGAYEMVMSERAAGVP